MGVLPVGRDGSSDTAWATMFWSEPVSELESVRADVPRWRERALALWPEAAPLIDQVHEPAQLRIECSDAIGWMGRSAPARFELVLLDPPFDAGLFEPALKLAAPLLVPGGLIYLEAPELLAAPSALGLEPWRSGRAGAVHYQLLRRSG